MDKKTYLENRKKQESSLDEVPMRKLCYSCYRPILNCMCSKIIPFDPGMDIIILMHPKEARPNRIGTGRIAAQCLMSSRVYVGVDFTKHDKVNELLNDPNRRSVLLYPGSNSVNISSEQYSSKELTGKRLTVFVIDGTWACAKKMVTESCNLHSLPRVCFSPTSPSRYSIKAQPDPLCLSSIEAIYYLIDEWNSSLTSNKSSDHKILMEMLDDLVEFQKNCALDPNLPSYRRGPFKNFEERRVYKKWGDRKIFFE